ncbi:MAG: hypothetical protein KDA84_19380, partial [Planctomycetaceae bacterium]|nr:hypothetical protein [Planctomycetaceae bacterium]
MRYFLGVILTVIIIAGMGLAFAMERVERERRVAARHEATAQMARKADLAERERLERQEQEERERQTASIRLKLAVLRKARAERLSKSGDTNPAAVQVLDREIMNLERELERLSDRPQENPRDEIAGKIEHLHAATEHLHQAGMPDLARELHERAETMERELHRHHAEHSPDGR